MKGQDFFKVQAMPLLLYRLMLVYSFKITGIGYYLPI